MPNFSFDLARRYLYGKKSTNSINIITSIAIFGIAIGTAALILILSVFNGFENLLSGLFNAFNPDIIVEPKEGKYFPYDDKLLKQIEALPQVKALSPTLEEVALFEYKDIQEIGIIKGVDKDYLEVTRLDSSIVDGRYLLSNDNIEYAILGIGLRNKLSLNIDDRLTPLSIYMPTKKQSIVGKDFKKKYAYPAGVFSVKSDNDYQYVICSIDLAAQLIEEKGKASYIEIALHDNSDEQELKQSLATIFNPEEFKIKNRYQQDETFLKVMNIEKWVSFLIAALTMLLVSFNLLGALWMISLDKKQDLAILHSMGYNKGEIKKLVMILGLMITGIGLLLGYAIALLLYFFQKKYGLIGVPTGFLIDAYPVKMKLFDFTIVTVSVFIIGWVASFLPASKAAKNLRILRTN